MTCMYIFLLISYTGSLHSTLISGYFAQNTDLNLNQRWIFLLSTLI